MIGIVDERLDQDDTTSAGYMLDGFPRTVAPGRGARRASPATGRSTWSIDLEVPEEVVIERIASRRVCVDCGAIYSVDAPPQYAWHCDNCGGDVVQRDDDTEEAIRRRLDLYEQRDRAAHRVLRGPRRAASRVDGLGDHRRGVRPARWPRSTERIAQLMS